VLAPALLVDWSGLQRTDSKVHKLHCICLLRDQVNVEWGK
jgi:hypothetical protein